MKTKLYLLMLVLFFVFVGALNCAFASQEVSNLDASVGVNSVFTISASPPTLNFGSVDPGSTTEARVGEKT